MQKGRSAPENYAGPVGPDNLIYIIYSSGSTGKPKGIALAHGALASIYRAWEVDLPPG